MPSLRKVKDKGISLELRKLLGLYRAILVKKLLSLAIENFIIELYRYVSRKMSLNLIFSFVQKNRLNSVPVFSGFINPS